MLVWPGQASNLDIKDRRQTSCKTKCLLNVLPTTKFNSTNKGCIEKPACNSCLLDCKCSRDDDLFIAVLNSDELSLLVVSLRGEQSSHNRTPACQPEQIHIQLVTTATGKHGTGWSSYQYRDSDSLGITTRQKKGNERLRVLMQCWPILLWCCCGLIMILTVPLPSECGQMNHW